MAHKNAWMQLPKNCIFIILRKSYLWKTFSRLSCTWKHYKISMTLYNSKNCEIYFDSRILELLFQCLNSQWYLFDIRIISLWNHLLILFESKNPIGRVQLNKLMFAIFANGSSWKRRESVSGRKLRSWGILPEKKSNTTHQTSFQSFFLSLNWMYAESS